MLEPCRPPEPFAEIQSIDLTGWQFEREHAAFRSVLSAVQHNLEEIEAEERFNATQREIAELFRRADLGAIKRDASSDNAAAQSLLGHAFLFGAGGMTKDMPKAILWLERAAEQGTVDAMATLGTIHSLLVTPADWTRALAWFERAAAHGHAASAQEASQIHARGFEGVPKNLLLAQRYRLLAASLAEVEHPKDPGH
jgi:hypothetical protein